MKKKILFRTYNFTHPTPPKKATNKIASTDHCTNEISQFYHLNTERPSGQARRMITQYIF